MNVGFWFLPSGNPAPTRTVSPSMATGEFVPAGSFFCQTTAPVLLFSAHIVPSNVVVQTRSLDTAAAP